MLKQGVKETGCEIVYLVEQGGQAPVTGSAHCTLIPYWAQRLGKPRMRALQVSQRGGELWCEIGAGQGKAAAKLPSGPLRSLGVFRDLTGRDRYAGWEKPERER